MVLDPTLVSLRSGAGRQRRGSLAVLLAGLLPLLSSLGGGGALRAQDLVGCQLVEGQLQCVPGVTADPQQQINILQGQIATDQQLEGAVQQQISGLRQLVLQGQAQEGALLQATVQMDGAVVLPPSAYHWYRSAPGSRQWQLIPNVKGALYVLQPVDVGQQLMVVVATPAGQGSQRASSAPLGPVQPR